MLCMYVNRRTEVAIRAIVTKFRTKFTLFYIKPPTRLCRRRTEENIAAISSSVNDDYQLSSSVNILFHIRYRSIGRLDRAI